MDPETFTGQKIVRTTKRDPKYGGHDPHGEDFVICPECKTEVSLNISYFDSYRGKNGKQVHYKCLFAKRLAEIKKEIEFAQSLNITNTKDKNGRLN